MNQIRSFLKPSLKLFVVLVGFIASFIAIYQFVSSADTDLSGKWRFDFEIEQSEYNPYKDLKIGYVVYLTQTNLNVKGAGEKWWENGVELPFSQHVPITFEGQYEEDKLRFLFELQGANRSTVGQLVLELLGNGKKMAGRFSTTGANSSGRVSAVLLEK